MREQRKPQKKYRNEIARGIERAREMEIDIERGFQRERKFGEEGWGNAIFYASSVTDKKQRLHQLKESPNRAFN